MLTRHCHCSDPWTPHFWNWTSYNLGLMVEYHKVISQLNTQLESTLPTSTTMLLAESASSMWKCQRRRTQQILCQAWPSFQWKLLQIQHPKWKCGFWCLLSILKLHTTASCTSSSIRIPLVLSWMTSAPWMMTGHQSSAQHTTRPSTTQEPLVASKTEDTDIKYLKLKDWLNSSRIAAVKIKLKIDTTLLYL